MMSDNDGAERDPTRIGNYVVERRLGEGSFGVTFLVYHRDDKLKESALALKWLRQGAEPGAESRFQNEHWALQNLDHPAFPKFVDSGTFRGRPYLVMTFAEGRTVGDRVQDNIRNRTFFSTLNVLLIAQHLIEALIYLGQQKLMHRDIKDENVIVSSSGNDVTLIDLGLCKGPLLPVQDETFWNAGAARFAPPAKIANATASILSHDLFAVGVLCYRMLTNAYPWQVGKDKGVGDLKLLMETNNPVAIQEINNAPESRLCSLIFKMIDISDSTRILINQALDEIREIRLDLENAVFPTVLLPSPVRLSRVVRDPLHGDIQMTDLEFAVLNCSEIQRLRRIRQLGTTHLVYPGAEHSRLAHVVGVLHVVEKVLRSIEMREGFSFTPDERWIARLYALVHDVAHAPFGHTLEDELGFFGRHDNNRGRLDRIFQRQNAELPVILEATSIGRSVMDLMYGAEGRVPLTWIETLLSGSVGADVLDYVDRDAFYCGLDLRIDSAIFRRFTIDRVGPDDRRSREIIPRIYGNHGLRLDADYAVLSVLESRYALFLKVYGHSVKTAAGAMIGKALAIAMRDQPERVAEEAIEAMGDEELLFFLRESGLPDVTEFIQRYHNRRLYRPVFRARVMQGAETDIDNYRSRRRKFRDEGLFDPRARLDIESDIAKDAGIDAKNIIIYCGIKAPGARTVTQRVEESRGEIITRDEIFSNHKEVFTKHLRLWNLYLFANPELPDETKGRLSSLMKRRFGLVDEQANDRKQLALNL